MTFPVTLRPMRETDRGFVIGGWLNSYLRGTGAMRVEPIDRYKPAQRAIIAAALERGVCIVACSPSDEDALHGFVVGTRNDCAGCGLCEGRGSCGELHYAYVTLTRRRQGLARMMLYELARGGVVARSYSHRTIVGDRVLSKLGLRYSQHATVRLLHAHQEDLRTRWNQGDGPATDPVLPRCG